VRTPTPDLSQHPSPNCGERRNHARPDLIVLHYTAMISVEVALDRLCDPAAEVSCHYLIAEDGRLWQLVPEDQRAWHAGAGQWGSVRDVNSRSIGIELANTSTHPFPEPQMAALEALMPGIMTRWDIPVERVIGHSDMAPARKYDPGGRFDWQRLARQGLSIWPDTPRDPAGQGFDALAETFGYAPTTPQDDRLCAFRDRFRPGANGPLCKDDLMCLADLAARFPVDAHLPSA